MKKLLVFLLFIACTGRTIERSLTPEEFSLKYKNTANAILLDVRTEEEVSKGAMANSRNIVYDDFFAGKLSGLPVDAPIFVYCAAGKRSAKAAEILREKGFKEVYQLKGGLNAWREAKLPM